MEGVVVFPLLDICTLTGLRPQIRLFLFLLFDQGFTFTPALLLFLKLLMVLFRILLHEVLSAILETVERMRGYLSKKSATGLIFFIESHAVLDFEAYELVVHQNYLISHILGRILHHKRGFIYGCHSSISYFLERQNRVQIFDIN